MAAPPPLQPSTSEAPLDASAAGGAQPGALVTALSAGGQLPTTASLTPSQLGELELARQRAARAAAGRRCASQLR